MEQYQTCKEKVERKHSHLKNRTNKILSKDIEYLGEKNNYEQYYKAKDSNGYKSYLIVEMNNIFESGYQLKEMIKELYILSQLNKNENIYKPIDIIYDKDDVNYQNDVQILYETMECCFDSLPKQQFTIHHVQYYLYLLLRALYFIHSSDLIHSEIIPAHFLLNANDDYQLYSFSRAMPLSHNNNLYNHTKPYLSMYSAPEILLNSQTISTSADIWSAGCILLEFAIKSQYFSFNDSQEALKEIVKLIGTPSFEDFCQCYQGSSSQQEELYKSIDQKQPIPLIQLFPNINLEVIDLLEKMLVFNPNKRFNAHQCLMHPFFIEVHDAQDICINSTKINFQQLDQIFNENKEKEFLDQLSKYFQEKSISQTKFIYHN